MAEVTRAELTMLKDALESVQAEQEQLTRDEEWFVSDCVDLVVSGLEIVYGHLGLHPPQDDDEEEYYDKD